MNPTDIEDPEYFHRVIDCQFACPAHTPVPEYIRLIAEKKYADAYMINWKSNVFPGILGRVCDRPCEPACRRGRVEDKAVAICRLKRVCADNKADITSRLPMPSKKKNGKKIALIGGGPASLTVARDLLPLGYHVDLYDDQAEAGGFVRSQVPSFRLPKEVLDEEVNIILNMGVKTHLNTYISSMKEFLAKGHDAVFVGTGAPRGRDLDLPGRQESKKSVHVGIEWLAGVQYGHTKKTGETTLVIGGGNTAMDCCRTARRLGGKQVKVIIRGAKKDMKASPWEVEDAVREDIPILEHLSPVEFVMENKRLKGMNFQNQQPGKEDREPVFIPCDEVLLAVGQQNAFPWIEKDIGLTFDDRGRPRVDEITFQSDLDHVFFGGDAAFGPRNVITAVAHGHEAALSIDLFCKGKDITKRPLPFTTLAGQKMGLRDWIYHSQVSDEIRQNVPMVPKVKSIKDRLMEVELGFNPKTGFKEARRCLNCDIQTVFTVNECIECDACVDVCPTTCINFLKNGDEEDLRSRLMVPAKNRSQDLYVSDVLPTGRVMVKDEDLCLHCGLCAERCPTAAWDMQKYTYNPSKAGQR
ncbi:FAD-dependent oxidoreductase [Desulfospira joergensenii]|uniref:FAD-dependent oxidoreductase n=1 Tax=Desulfospira joergensenii TaxID=53329 RepID=UPI0003B2E3B9|nr:FAD-dependent oxidoreductase [Desulfospira joergensenii]